MYWHNDRQWNTIESPDIDPHVSKQLIFDKNAKAIQWEKTVLTNCVGKFGHPYAIWTLQ